MRTLLGVLSVLFSSGTVFAAGGSLGWDCTPSQLLMGQWSVSIRESVAGYVATTSYMRNIGPGVHPVVQTLAVKAVPIVQGVEFSGQDFQLNIYPRLTPKRNPFPPGVPAAAAQAVQIRFAPDAFLANRPYACRLLK